MHGYTNLNFALIMTNQDGWQAMAYVKNVLDTTAITGAFLNSDDSALTTNVFTTDPRLFGIRLTKSWPSDLTSMKIGGGVIRRFFHLVLPSACGSVILFQARISRIAPQRVFFFHPYTPLPRRLV